MTDNAAAERIDEHLAGIDTAADWFPFSACPPLPCRAKLPRLDMTAHDAWKAAWQRGLISDIDMAWYTMLINCHPGSWLGWLKWRMK